MKFASKDELLNKYPPVKGALSPGTKVIKQLSEPNDITSDGSTGTIITSCKLTKEKLSSLKNPHNTAEYGYFVQFKSGISFVIGTKLTV